jgi:polysaccharide export outer membrane protein
MTITPIFIVRALVLAGLALQPLTAAAQSARATVPGAPASRQAPPPAGTPQAAPAPRPADPAAPRATATSNRPWTEQEYRLGAGDKLRIEVYGHPQLSQGVQIRPDGKITLPLVGDIMATGRTSIELRDAVAESLKEYVTNPVVTAIVQEATSAQVHVIGEVQRPGAQVLLGPLTVLQALAAAGGLGEFAKKGDIRILRGANQAPIPFKYKDALDGKIGPVFVQPGDTIVVP